LLLNLDDVHSDLRENGLDEAREGNSGLYLILKGVTNLKVLKGGVNL